MDAEGYVEFLQDVLEAPRLDAPAGGLGVAVHRIAAPQHAVAGAAHRFDHARQMLLDVLDAEAVNQRQAAGWFCGLRIATSSCNHSSLIAAPTLTPIGLAMPRKYSTCAPSTVAVRMPIQGMCVDRLYQRSWRGMWRVWACSYSRCRPSWLEKNSTRSASPTCWPVIDSKKSRASPIECTIRS